MKHIQTVTVGSGGASTIEFTSIPQTYTDLVCLVSLRGTTSQVYILADIFFNGSTSSFSSIGFESNGSNVVTYSNPSTIYINAGNGATSTSGVFSSHKIYIANYTGSTNKSVSADGVTENNATTAYSSFQSGLWANTSAITSIQIKARADQFSQYSTASLYGIKNS